MPSPFRESILNAIACGFETRMDISLNMGIGYTSVSNNIRKLIKEGRVLTHEGESGEVYTLRKSERWRLYSFDHVKVFIENVEPYFFECRESAYVLEGVTVYKYRLEGEGIVSIIQHDDDIEEIFDLIDDHPILKNHIPVLMIPPSSQINERFLKNIQSFVLNKLPIYFINERYELVPIQTPSRCEIIEFENESLEELYSVIESNPMKNTSEVADIVEMDKETIRKKLKILENQEKIESVRNGHFAETAWRTLEKNP